MFIVPALIFDVQILVSDDYSYLIGACFLLLAIKRYYQAKYIRTYKKYLNDLPMYQITVQDLYKIIEKNKASKRVFAGKGFKWSPIHTQRFYDLESVQDFHTYKRTTESALGGFPHIHGVGALDETDFYINRDDRIGHMLIYGQSRSGKSRTIELLLEQDIAHGNCVILADPKGDKDLVKRLIIAAERANRLDDVVILHLGFLAESVKYNPVKTFQKVSEVAGRISSKLPDGGGSSAFAMFAWRFINIAALAMNKVGEDITIQNIKKHVKSFDGLLIDYTRVFLKLSPEDFKAKVLSKPVDHNLIPKFLQGKSEDTIKTVLYLEEIKEKVELDEILEDIIAAYSYDKTYYDKITASLLPFLDQLSALNEVTSSTNANSDMPELILEEAIKQKKIIFFGLDGLSDNVIAKAMGSMFFADLVSTAGKLYKSQENFTDVIVHADEFNDIIGPDFIPLLNKAGGAGVIINAYTQTDDDIDLGFDGSKTKALVAKGNFRTVGIMRVATEATADYFGQRLTKTNVKYTVQSTNLSDSDSDLRGTSASTGDTLKDKEVKLVENSAIMSQPVGQTFFAKNGNNIYHVRTPLIKEDLTGTIGSIDIEGPDGGLKTIIKKVNLKQLKLKKEDVVSSIKNDACVNQKDVKFNTLSSSFVEEKLND